ncbi:MAG: hypothetical protein LBL65_03210 [Campylobacteraceae bacterium]|jgi:hypothetical protein|nr:hypothetical protein [Campylobacteraceae bacterium]
MRKAVVLVLFAVFSYAEVLPYLDKNDDFKIVKNINIIIDRWNKTLSHYNGSISFFNQSIGYVTQGIDRANTNNETGIIFPVKDITQSIDRANIHKDKLSYDVVFENLYKAKNELLSYKNIDIDQFATAKSSKVCRQILDEKLFLKQDSKYIVYSDNASKRLLFSTTHFSGISKTPSLFDIKIDNDIDEKNETQIYDVISIFEEKKSHRYDNDAKVEIYTRLWGSDVNIFAINGAIYLNLLPHIDDGIYRVFVYDKKGKLFDQACEIKRSVTDYRERIEKQNKLCQKVINGQYTKPEWTSLFNIFDNTSLSQFKKDISTAEKKFRRFEFGIEYNRAFLVDYDNTGKKKLLLNAMYASGTGAWCNYYMYLTYETNEQEKFATLAPNDEDSYFYTKHISECFQKEELITVDGKNYILTAFNASGSYNNNKDIYSLYEMKRDKNGTLQSEQVCDFVPIYKYE